MRCPVCQGLSIADSPTPLAVSMKHEVEDLLAAGYSGEQVIGYFESTYGEFIRLEPRAEGFNLVVWLLPAVALLTGFLLVVRRLRTPTVPRADDELEEDDLDAYRAQVRREVGP